MRRHWGVERDRSTSRESLLGPERDHSHNPGTAARAAAQAASRSAQRSSMHARTRCTARPGAQRQQCSAHTEAASQREPGGAPAARSFGQSPQPARTTRALTSDGLPATGTRRATSCTTPSPSHGAAQRRRAARAASQLRPTPCSKHTAAEHFAAPHVNAPFATHSRYARHCSAQPWATLSRLWARHPATHASWSAGDSPAPSQPAPVMTAQAASHARSRSEPAGGGERLHDAASSATSRNA